MHRNRLRGTTSGAVQGCTQLAVQRVHPRSRSSRSRPERLNHFAQRRLRLCPRLERCGAHKQVAALALGGDLHAGRQGGGGRAGARAWGAILGMMATGIGGVNGGKRGIHDSTRRALVCIPCPRSDEVGTGVQGCTPQSRCARVHPSEQVCKGAPIRAGSGGV